MVDTTKIADGIDGLADRQLQAGGMKLTAGSIIAIFAFLSTVGSGLYGGKGGDLGLNFLNQLIIFSIKKALCVGYVVVYNVFVFHVGIYPTKQNRGICPYCCI